MGLLRRFWSSSASFDVVGVWEVGRGGDVVGVRELGRGGDVVGEGDSCLGSSESSAFLYYIKQK